MAFDVPGGQRAGTPVRSAHHTMRAGRGRAGSGEQRNRRGSAGTLQFAAAVVVAPTYPQAVFALDYPTRSLRRIVGFPPGGGSDTVMRITANGCRSASVSRSSSKTSPAPPPTSRSRRPSALAPDGLYAGVHRRVRDRQTSHCSIRCRSIVQSVADLAISQRLDNLL